MARGTTRSQKAPRASQSQPSQSQRSRRASRHDEEQDEEEEEARNEDDGDVDMDAGRDKPGGEKDLTRRSNELARLALFNEQKRTPLRRDDITKKILGADKRTFNAVFEGAQQILREAFGMEMVELRTRAAERVAEKDADGKNKKGAAGNSELEEARNATGVKKRAAATGSKTYILRSILNPLIIELAAQTDENILEDEAADAPSDDDDDENGFGCHQYGSIISWSTADQLGSTGVLYVILSLILVSGRVISDIDLRANLKNLRLPPKCEILYNAQATYKSLPIDAYLNLLTKQNYLDYQRVGEAKGAGAGKGKRGRAPAATQNNEEGGGTIEWRWGSRAHSEVGETGIARFVAEFMVERMGAEEAEDEEEGGGGRRKEKERQDAAKKRLQGVLKGVQRAAGGELQEIK